MNPKLALITGYAKDPEFAKTLLLALNNQSLKDFDCYVYASPAVTYFLDEDFISNLNYPCYHLKLDKNEGFAGNNNYAIGAAYKNKDYENIVLVNDDTIPDENFLKEMVRTAESTEGVGAVAAKMVFYQKFVSLTGITTSAPNHQDERSLGVRIYANTRFSTSFYPKRFYKKGFYRNEEDEINPFKWTEDHFTIELPVVPTTEEHYQLKLFSRKNPFLKTQSLQLRIGGLPVGDIALQMGKVFYEISVPKAVVEKNWHNIIQNVGSGSTPSHSYEIGFGEIDEGQYEIEREVSLFCGGACLITRKALLETGLFTGGLFSYYEDSDLSMRLRKKGYKIIYSPNSLIYHYHTGTSKEWSPLFTYYAFRNRIIFAARTYGVRAFAHAFWERGRETYVYFKLYVKSRFRNKDYRYRLRLNLIILKDSLIGIIKFKPKFLTK